MGFCEALQNENITFFRDVPLKDLTTFRIGGPCAFLVRPHTEEEMTKTLAFCRAFAVKYNLIGNGSNVLASDRGFDGAVIKPAADFCGVTVRENRVFAQSGASLKSVFDAAAAHDLGGAEFLAAIPARVGGAVAMNAGCFGREVKDALTCVRVADEKGCHVISAREARLGYRTSAFLKNGIVVTGAEFVFFPSQKEKIMRTVQKILQKKRETQPLDKPSAGSVFKKPQNDSAGRLIELCGLKGARVGGAEVSQKHAGFIVNAGGASCKDVLQLMRLVRERVMQKFGVELQPELRLLGETDDHW